MEKMDEIVSTFSIVALDMETGEVGVAVASKFFAVGAVVPWAKANSGAAVTQAGTKMSQGPAALELMLGGYSAERTREQLMSDDPERDQRQVAFVDLEGGSAPWTGSMCLPWAGHKNGMGYSCQGNLLSGPQVVEAMVQTFENNRGALPERMVSALEAGESAGGDSRGKQSAAIYIAKEGGSYGGYTDRYIDLRVDDHVQPVTELRRLLDLHRLTFASGGRQEFMTPEGNVVQEIQRMLKALGYDSGGPTNEYDAATQGALWKFCQVENLEERQTAALRRGPEWIDREVLSHLRRTYASDGGGD